MAKEARRKDIPSWSLIRRPIRSWDCPCHGSRFDRFGVLLNGPANANLEKVEVRWEDL